MSDRVKLMTARQLIDEKNYDAARAVLKTIPDSSTAQRWLSKLDEIAPQKTNVVRQIEVSGQPKSPARVPAPVLSNTIHYSVVCPQCKKQTFQPISPDVVIQRLVCSHCNKAFIMNLYQIRASSSRGYDSYKRTYNIRVIGSNSGEQLLTFSTQKDLKMELRSKDIAGFTYLNRDLKIVQNFTINRYWKITDESWLTALIVIACIVIAIISWLATNLR